MRFVVVFSILLGIVTLSAQDQVLSLQQGTLRDWTMQKDTMMKISAAMPGEKFTFKPTPPQRNFGEQVLHVVEANVNQINRLGSKVPAPPYNMKETDRAEILKMLEASFDYGTAALQSFSDQDCSRPPFRRGPTDSWAARIASASSTTSWATPGTSTDRWWCICG